MNQSKEEYEGKENVPIKLYFYLSNGLSVVNEFRNLLLGIFGLYITLKLDSPIIMLFLFISSCIALTGLGWVMVHKVSKVKEWLSTKHGSHYAIQNFNYTKGIYEELKKFNDK